MHSSGVPSTHAPVSTRYSRRQQVERPVVGDALHVGRVAVVAELLLALVHPLRDRPRSGGRRPSGTTRTTRAPSPTPRRVVGAHSAIVNVAAWLLTNLPIGVVHCADRVAVDVDLLLAPPRATRRPRTSTARGRARRPAGGRRRSSSRPRSAGAAAAAAWAARAASASTSACPRTRTRSLVQQPTTCSIASCHISRVSCGSMPKPSSSTRVDERPVPKSTRPSEMQVEHRDRLRGAHRMVVRLRHRAARRSRGACSRCGAAIAPYSTSGFEQCEYSSRKWCSTVQNAWKPEPLAGDRLLERVLVRDVLAVGRPTAGRRGSRRTGRSACPSVPLSRSGPDAARRDRP